MSFEIFCNECKLNKPELKMTKGVLTALCKSCGHTGVLYEVKSTQLSPSSFIMPFGKYKGESVAEIVATDPAYAQWASENLQDPKIRNCFEKELGS